MCVCVCVCVCVYVCVWGGGIRCVNNLNEHKALQYTFSRTITKQRKTPQQDRAHRIVWDVNVKKVHQFVRISDKTN